MEETRRESNGDPSGHLGVRRLAFEAARRADAMGLFKPGDRALDLAEIRRLVGSVTRAGVARAQAFALDNVERPSASQVEALLRMLIAALERSPVPGSEWPSLSRVFEADQLAALLGISVSSLRRYQSGERVTPDDVAARLHFLVLVVADLAGTYNEIGIRRWFERPRARLDGKRPSALLSGNWDPEGAGPQKVRSLAQSLVELSVS
jgi:uncharacterized protein (DUF2384 family)